MNEIVYKVTNKQTTTTTKNKESPGTKRANKKDGSSEWGQRKKDPKKHFSL